MQRRLLRQTTKAMVIFNYIFALTRIRIVTGSISGYVLAGASPKFICGNVNFQAIKLHGRPWLQERMSSVQALPAGFLSNSQLGELNRAYSDKGVQELQTDRKVAYYDAVSYEVLGQVDDKLGRHDAHTSKDDGVVRVKVRVGDMIEFRADFEADGRGFAEVVAVMQHQDRVFLVVSWIERIANHHPLLKLP